MQKSVAREFGVKMAKRKPAFEVEDLLPDDERLDERGNLWKDFMDTVTAGMAVLNQLSVFKCPRQLRAVIEQQFGFWFSVIKRSLLALRRWLVLRGRKRKLEPQTGGPPHEADSGEPLRKYANIDEKEELPFEEACELMQRDPTDESQAEDVESGSSQDGEEQYDRFDLDNRAELETQLEKVVAERKRTWAQSGLLQLMESIEDPDHNMLSHNKVEKWLFGQRGGAFDMTQGCETLMTEQNADGDRMEYHRKQQVTVSRSVDEADSLYSVDTAKYIMQNKNDRNSTSKIKVTTMIKQYTKISTNNSNSRAMKPSLHSISGFPNIQEEPTASTSRLHKTSKTDSAFETVEDQSQIRSKVRKAASPPHRKPATPSPVTQQSKKDKRKKVFKKTIKKKSALKSPSRKEKSRSTQQFEEALKHCASVNKIQGAKQRRIHWQESTLVAESSSDDLVAVSSSDESDKVFTRNTRSKAKALPKRVLRSKKDSRSSETPELSPRKQSPRKKAISPRKKVDSPRKKVDSPRKKVDSPPKTVDRDLVLPFEAICLSPRKQIATPQRTQQQPPPPVSVNQTTNMTALFSGENDQITNSTAISNTTAVSKTTTISSKSLAKGSWGRCASSYPDVTRGIVVYEPKKIQQETNYDEKVRITVDDLTLRQVNKAQHLERFKTFDFLIHPNSSLIFFPSDSEDDETAPTVISTTTNTNVSAGDESFDDDDPILTFKPRFTDRLNVMEQKYHL